MRRIKLASGNFTLENVRAKEREESSAPAAGQDVQRIVAAEISPRNLKARKKCEKSSAPAAGQDVQRIIADGCGAGGVGLIEAVGHQEPNLVGFFKRFFTVFLGFFRVIF